MDQDLVSKKRRLFIILGAIILLIVIGLVWYFGFVRKKAVSTTQTQTPIASPVVSSESTANVGSPTNSKSPQNSAPTASNSSASVTQPTTATITNHSIAPEIKTVSTFDSDGNGKIDTIDVMFVNHPTDCGMNRSITSVAGFDVKGYSIKSGSWSDAATYSCPDDRASYPDFMLRLKEGDSSDTDATPLVSYKNSIGSIKSSSGLALASFDMKAVDSASPIILSAVAVDANGQAGIQAGDKVVLNFSEPVKMNPDISASCGGAGGMNPQQNMDNNFKLDSGHTWYDGSCRLASIPSISGNTMTVTLSATGKVPTIAVGDYIEATDQQVFDMAGNRGSGQEGIKITGSF